jgi:hypothetical protein
VFPGRGLPTAAGIKQFGQDALIGFINGDNCGFKRLHITVGLV